jgi:hypothetical protein
MLLYILGLGLMSGFLLGHFSFKLKNRWCRRCGLGLVCPECTGASLHQMAHGSAVTAPFNEEPSHESA